VAPGRLEQHRGDDRQRDRQLQARTRGGEPDRRRDGEVGATDRDPQRGVGERPAHRTVDVEQVGPDEPDDDRRRQGDERGDHEWLGDGGRQHSGLLQQRRDGRDDDREHPVQRPADLHALRTAQAAVAQADDDRPDERGERERGIEVRARRRAEKRERADVYRARDLGEGRVAGLRAPAEDPRRLQHGAREQQQDRYRDRQPGDDAHEPSFVSMPVAAVGIDGQQRDHRGALGEPEPLDRDVRRAQPPAAAGVVEPQGQRDRAGDEERRGSAEGEQAARGEMLGADAKRDHARGVGAEEGRAPGQAEGIAREHVREQPDRRQRPDRPRDQQRPGHTAGGKCCRHRPILAHIRAAVKGD
jgi:hypothetical protein